METWFLVATVLTPLLAIIFSDDLRKLRRVVTVAFNFARGAWTRMREWYENCEERDFTAMLVNNPEEATPAFIGSLLDSEETTYWRTQIGFTHTFMVGSIWKYRGFCASLGWQGVSKDGDKWTWAVAAPPSFSSATGRKSSRKAYWTESAVIDAATAYIDDQIEESGLADYRPPRRFRVLRWLRNPTLKRKAQSLQQTA